MEHPFRSYKAVIPGARPHSKSGKLVGRTYQFCQATKEAGLGGVLLGFYMSSSDPVKVKIALGIEMSPDLGNQISLSKEKVDAFGRPGSAL